MSAAPISATGTTAVADADAIDLPTMADLDELVAELDQIDATLAELR